MCSSDLLGETLQPAPPVRQWLDWLDAGLRRGAALAGLDPERHGPGRVLVEHAASPLERPNFLARAGRPPASCDRRQLAARLRLEQPGAGGITPLLFRPMPPGSSGAAEPPEELFEDLRAWLMGPQRQWLRTLGLRASEWERSLEDLEPLSLGERDRAGLLRDIERQAEPPEAASDWLKLCRGEGLLPPGSAAVLEVRRLESRRRGMEQQAAALGDPWQGEVVWGPWRSEQGWRGDAVVVMHWAKGGPIQLLDLWLQLTLAAAAGARGGRVPSRGVLLARDKGDRISGTTLLAPDQEEARRELERLADLRERWRAACWPVPPRTGWTWWEQERQARSGQAAAQRVWEGAHQQDGERRLPEMVTCFGGDLPLTTLLQDPFPALARELMEPVQAALVARKGRGKG